MATAVVCENCTGGQTPAVKTCLRCEMSFCAMHVSPHLENPRLSDHVLVAPIANLEERRCRQHRQEQINFYCEQDESLVCTVCTIAGEHRGHEVIPVENAQQTKQETFRLEKTGREKKKTIAESRTQQLKGAYRRVQKSLSGTKARISREFERRREQLREEEREALERVDEEGRSLLSRIQADIARYESTARDLEQEINQLLASLAVQDPLVFLQDPLHESLRRSCVSLETQDDLAPVSHGLNLGKVISVGGVQTKLLPFLDGRSPTLDANSARDRLQISSDLRTVTWSRVLQGRPHHPHPFECWDQALCSESFSSGQHYWEVDVGSAWWCRIGVAYGTIPWSGSGDECLLGGSDVSWCLQKEGERFSVLHGGVATSMSVPEPPRRVGVHLDWDAGLLSFYRADSMSLLNSFHQTFAQPLHPGLAIWGWDDGDSVRIVDLNGAS
ncbi:E3 ubiquitin-protein ligase TRIM58-like [Lethenteron reissneri]|uniref:E3 ubiquitin-protein ligase TRIM58-like n=1 Tax=Lethenteron reissneri TaxID=7753 RepID=UPI002AB6C1C7|nr:E3 ubiquitin-protein ligase TRIM58-like [Lethenteron reissneri]